MVLLSAETSILAKNIVIQMEKVAIMITVEKLVK